MTQLDKRHYEPNVRAVAISPGGNLAAIAVNEERIEILSLCDRRLDRLRTLELTTDRYHSPLISKLLFSDVHLTFADDGVLIVARQLTRFAHRPSQLPAGHIQMTNVVRVDLKEGRVTHDHLEPWATVLQQPVLRAGDCGLLLNNRQTVVLLRMNDLQPLARVRQVCEGDGIDETGERTDEQISPGGIAWDTPSQRLDVQWQRFNEVTWQSYRLAAGVDKQAPEFHSLRRVTWNGVEGNGLVRSPWDHTLVAWHTSQDRFLPAAVCPADQSPPAVLELGRIILLTDRDGNDLAESKAIVVDGQVPQDFIGGREEIMEADGTVRFRGYRFGVDSYAAHLYFPDPGHVIVTTPGGACQSVDILTNRNETLETLSSAISCRDFDHSSRLMMSGLEDGQVILETI